VHPDRFASAPQAEQRVSMQLATLVNEAYQTLKSPLRRAGYLLQLQGVDPEFETNTAMPAEFLADQMEKRERLEEAAAASDWQRLIALSSDLRVETGFPVRENREAARGSGLERGGGDLAAAQVPREIRRGHRCRRRGNGLLMALLQISEPGQSPAPHEQRLAVGIDLGTTNSLVASVRNGIAVVLKRSRGPGPAAFDRAVLPRRAYRRRPRSRARAGS